MEYYFKPTALRELRKLPRNIQKRILDKLDFFMRADNPMQFADTLIDKMLGEFRFRISDYRIIFDVVGDKIFILPAFAERHPALAGWMNGNRASSRSFS